MSRFARSEAIVFAMALRLGYEWQAVKGEGVTVTISSEAVAFACDAGLVIDAPVTLRIAWPVTLEDGESLRLVTAGYVLNVFAGGAYASIVSWEFRVAKARGV